MSWPLASAAVLGLALATGFAWYERSRPDARVLALVATLAAFAALGRIAFAALPNVKPTSDIVLISGYALGGAPGFAVGAIAGLSSNFFFGQGPWTPWQMVGWGATGLVGALLARVCGRDLGRWPLAAVCGVAGYAFTALQDVGDWANFSDHSVGQLGAYVARGTGFDIVHATGCVVFALAFGPALARSIRRFVRRLDITWGPASGISLPVLAGAAVLAAGLGLGPGASGARAASPLQYLRAAQNADGGFGASIGSPSSSMFSGWAALGFAAEGINPLDVTRDGHSVIDYLSGGAGGLADPGALERTILAIRAAGLSPDSFGGRNLLAALLGDVRANGSVAGQVNLTAFAVLALRAAGVAPASNTIAWLLRQQNRDGGFSFAGRGGSSDVDDTGAALEALAGAPGAAATRARARAVAFVAANQDRDGGFAAEIGGEPDAQSAAWAIQGLLAAGVSPASLHRHGAVSPESYLDSLIEPNGSIAYQRSTVTTPVWVTAQALMALAGKPLPIAAVPRAKSPAARAPHAPAAAHRSTRAGGPNARRGQARRRAARSRTATTSTAADARVNSLVAWVGALTAVALAPVGAS